MTTTTYNLTTGHHGSGTTIIVQGPHAHLSELLGRHVRVETPCKRTWLMRLVRTTAALITIVATFVKTCAPAY